MLISPARLGKVAALVSSAAVSLLFCNVAKSASIDAQVPVSFGFSDYAELGYVRDRIRPAYQEIKNINIKLSTDLNYVGLASQSLSTALDTAGKLAKSDVSKFIEFSNTTYNTLSALQGVVDATSINSIGSSFSPIDFSKSTASIQKLTTDLNELKSQISKPIEPPTLQLYYAVAVSSNARQEATELRADVLSGQDSLRKELANVNQSISILKDYSEQLGRASNVSFQIGTQLGNLMADGNILAKPLAENYLSSKLAIDNQKQLVDETIELLSQSSEGINQRINESNDLIDSIDYALTSKPLPSKWMTFAETGPLNSGYALFFDGREFDYPYTEIDGRFLLGTLTVFNYVSLGYGDSLTTTNLEFEALRTVIDPLLGKVETRGVALLNMSYFATLNSDDPNASADYFSIPSLGINIHIYENDYYAINVYGQYNSPLRIVAMEPVLGSKGGFITPITVPTPALLPGLVSLGIAILRKKREQENNHCSSIEV